MSLKCSINDFLKYLGYIQLLKSLRKIKQREYIYIYIHIYIKKKKNIRKIIRKKIDCFIDHEKLEKEKLSR